MPSIVGPDGNFAGLRNGALSVHDTGYADDIGSVNNLGQNVGDTVVFKNEGGYSTIGFHFIPPTGGVAAFEASFDNVHWAAVTVRGVDSDVVCQSADSEDDFVGSIAGGRSFRVRTTVGGSAPGTVMGRQQRDAAIIETIEFGAPPHKIGYDILHKDANYTTAQTGTAFWTPASGKRFVVTDLGIFASGSTDAVLTLYDGTDTAGSRIFKSYIEVATNRQFTMTHAFKVPWVSSAANNVLKVTTSANLTVYVGAHGYEV